MTYNNDEIIQKSTTTIDDQSSEELGYIMSLLLKKARLMCHYPVYTKRKPSRHTTSHPEGDLRTVATILFEQTSTIGFRYQNVQRKVATRTFETQNEASESEVKEKNQYGTLNQH